MKEIKNKFFIIGLLFFNLFFSYSIYAQSLDETALELEMANRLEVMLEKLIGKERALVKVDIKISPRTSQENFLTPSLRNLPGVVFPEALQKSQTGSTSDFPNIENINVVVYLDNKLPQDKVNLVRASVPKWLELDFSRGDSLKIELIPWKENLPEEVAVKQLSFLKRNLWVIMIIGGILGLGILLFLILFIPTRKFIKERAKIKPEEKKLPDFEGILKDLKESLTQAMGGTSQGIDRLLEDIRDILTKTPTKTDKILEEVKETLEKIAQYQATLSAGGGAGGGAGVSVGREIGQASFLDALTEVVGTLKSTAAGGGVSAEALDALHKIEELMRKQVEASSSQVKILDEPFKYLNSLSVREILLFIEGEPARISAIILAHIEPQKATQVLLSLPQERQIEVSLALANLIEDEKVAQEIRDFLQRKIPEVKLKSDFVPVSGIKALAGILSHLSYDLTTSLLEKIERNNPSLAKAIKNELFLFEDITRLSDKAILEILKILDIEVLSWALSVASDKVKDKFYKNMSEKETQLLKEEIEALTPLREALSKEIVFFEDIVDLDSRVIQHIIRTVDKDTLKIALKGSSEEVREKFYSLLTERGKAMLKEDIEIMVDVSPSYVEEAQKKILDCIYNLKRKPFLSQQLILEKIKELERTGRISLTT